jgi:imidazolonepropionase-like amidohydrolase
MISVMKHLFTFALLFVALAMVAQPIDSRKQEIVFKSVNVVPMDQEKVLANQTVIVRGGKIAYVGDAAKARPGKNALVIDAQGKYLMPGLAEMHGHVPQTEDLEPMKDVMMLFAANGITTVRGMLGHPKQLELRDKIRSGEILAPHFWTTGPSFNGISVPNPAAGAEMVRKQKAAGYDFLKMHPGLTRDKFEAIAAAAHETGMPMVGHVSFGVGIWRAIDAGYATIDHLDGFIEGLVPGVETMEKEAGLFAMFIADKADTTRIPRLMQALKAKGIWIVPTQSLADRWFSPDFLPEDFQKDPHRIYLKPETAQQWMQAKTDLMKNPSYEAGRIRNFIQLRRKLILACQKNGVGLLLGCDAPQIFNVPGFSTHAELVFLVKAGLTPYQALQTGTVNVAKYLHREKETGTVKTGNIADLILVNGNPLENVSNTQAITGVMLDGHWMDRPYLDAALKKLEKNP